MNYTIHWKTLLYLVICVIALPITLMLIGICKVCKTDAPMCYPEKVDRLLKDKLEVEL